MSNKIFIKEDYTKTLIIQDKIIEELRLIYCEFKESVSILNCKIKNASFQAAYFGKDLLIKDSEFINYVDFSMGDFINTQRVFKIENVIFNEFVSFQDYNFRGKTILENVNFKKGTNLLGNKNTPVEVTFESEPILINVAGVLDRNDFK
jgi:hypothetical protein